MDYRALMTVVGMLVVIPRVLLMVAAAIKLWKW